MSVRGFFGKLFNKEKRRSSKQKGKRSSFEVPEGAMDHSNNFNDGPKIHTDAVMCTSRVSNGVCLSGSKDQTVALYDFNTQRLEQQWRVHDKEVTKVAFAEKLGTFFSASRDKNICMLKSGSPQPYQTYIGHEMVVTGLAVNPENTQLVSGSRDNSLRLWDINTGQCVLKNSISRNLVSHVHWAENCDLIAQVGEDKETRIFDSRSLQVLQTFAKKQYIQTWCEISEDNNYCVTCSNGFQGNGCEATLWDLRTTSIVHEFKGHVETCHCVRFVPRSLCHGQRLVVTSSSDCCVRVWDRDSQECLSCTELTGSGPLTSIAIFNDSKLCVSSYEQGVHVLKMDSKPGQCNLKPLFNF